MACAKTDSVWCDWLSGQPINLNCANEEALRLLPNVGQALAKRIVAYRQAHGPFTSIKELLEVKGIGLRTLHKLQGWLIVYDCHHQVSNNHSKRNVAVR